MYRESVPLLTGNMQTGNKLVIKRERELWMNAAEEEDEDKELLADVKKRSTSLTYTDAAILILQLIQVYCVLMSLSLRWTWPTDWLVYTRWIFFANLDFWDFLKLNGNNTYKSVQSYHTPSASLPIAYWHLLLIWGFIIFLLLLAYIIAYACIRSTHHPYLLVRIAKLQRVYLIFFQVFSIPFGVLIGRIFHCNADGYVDIDNELLCYFQRHWAYVIPVSALAVLLYVVLPVWMIFSTKAEIFNMPTDRHEAYLQLKETEYGYKMDIGWIVGHFHLFSSFKKWGAYTRPALHLCFFIILAFYAGAHSHIQVQAIAICIIIFIMFIAFVILRPFRLTCFNAFLCFSLLVLTVDSLLGGLLCSFTPTTITSVWLTPTYMLYLLGAVNGLWFITIIVFIVYIISRQVACCPGTCKCCRTPLWPTLNSNRVYKISPNTKRFVKAILKGRIVLDRILHMPPLFAPAHELGRQIHIINAYCREAEYLGDPIQNSLWDILDELIEAHSRIAPKSLFAESVKDSIRTTAAELMRMMPMFTRRLAQREYDFLLMRPVKRRLLLKMYCMSLFLNNRSDSAARHRMTQPYLQKVWKPVEIKPEIEEFPDDGYYEDMYPEHQNDDEEIFRPETAVGLDLMGFDEFAIEDEKVVKETTEETETWIKETAITPVSVRPITATTYTNLVFENDESSSDEDSPSGKHGSYLDFNQSDHVGEDVSQRSSVHSRVMSPVDRDGTPVNPRIVISPAPDDQTLVGHSMEPQEYDSEEDDEVVDIEQGQRSRSQMSHDHQPYESHDQRSNGSHDQAKERAQSQNSMNQPIATPGLVNQNSNEQNIPNTNLNSEAKNDDKSSDKSPEEITGDNTEPEGSAEKEVNFDNNVHVISVGEAEEPMELDTDGAPKDFAV